ncbi:hypothetical protein [Kitasatospora sp. NPDC047058]|uniref:hypothetical protein n=1 Tax=Kitasatospora sp. NPDC047058 TaxID=3155620 RepID=UPI0033C9AAAF
MAGNLYIRVAAADNGSRPFDSCHDAWKNESIWLDPPRPDDTTAEVDQPSVIKVRVRNLGSAALPFVRVHAYVSSPQIGLTSPAQAIADFISAPQTVPPAQTAPNGVVFDCGPWTPTAAQLAVSSNGGHLCLFANAFQDSNLADPPFDGKDLTPGTDTFDICGDPHQGQRNITLWAVAKGMRRLPAMAFRVSPLPKGVKESVLVLETLGKGELAEAGLQNVLLSRRDITRDEKNHLVIDTGEGKPVPLRLSTEPLKYDLETDGGHRGPRLPLNRDNHHRHTQAKLHVELDPNDPIGTVHAFDLVQRTPQGRHLGGVRVISVVTATGR